MDSQTELRCIPPDGIPMPLISWIRDGRTIDPKRDPNYIITADGHLLIAQTRLSDMGNYSCVAENIASRRVSEPALLTVYGKQAEQEMTTNNYMTTNHLLCVYTKKYTETVLKLICWLPHIRNQNSSLKIVSICTVLTCRHFVLSQSMSITIIYFSC